MTIRTISLEMAGPLPPLSLLLVREQRRQLLGEHSVALFHLTKFELPTGAASGLQLVKYIVFRGQCQILITDRQPKTTCGSGVTMARAGP